MAKYYSEEVEKESRYRKDYIDGINAFLSEEKSRAEKEREEFISPEKYMRDTEKYRGALCKQLGFPLNLKSQTPVLKEKTFITTDGNVNIYRMQFKFFGSLNFYGMYFEQTEDKEKKPFILGLHGGGGTPEIVSSIYMDSANYNHLVRRITDRGASVFAPQLLLWNKETHENNYDRLQIDGKLRQLGGSITALELYLMSGCIDYFIENESANCQRIGVAGLSYGGMYALHLAAVDARIKACYSCSWVNDCFINSWADWSYLGAQKKFATAETAAMVAPRALVVAMGDKDEMFDSKFTEKECEKVKEYYKVFGKEENFKYVIFDGVHETDKGEEEMGFLMENL